MNIQELKVSLFANHHAYSSSLMSLSQIVHMIRYDKIIAANTESYRKTMAVMGKQHADKHIKLKLVPAFSVAVTFSGLGHSEEQADHFTGLALCDIDHFKSEEELEAAVGRLSKDEHVLLMYRSIGGLGLHIIYWYKRENDKHIDDTSWRGAYITGNEYLAAVAQHEYDNKASDFTRLSGMAGDQNVYFNPQAAPFVITNDVIIKQNCEHQEHGRPRKEYAANSYKTTTDEAWPRVEQMLNVKKMRYEPGHHHDYIMHAAYLLNRFGVPLDDVIKFAETEWRDHPKDERERAIRYCYNKDCNFGTWRLDAAEKSRDNKPLALPEIRKWLSQRVMCCYNIITQQMLWCSKDDIPEANTEEETLLPITSDVWKPLDLFEINARYNQIALDTGRTIMDGTVERVIYSDFARRVHPIRQYMQTLPDWDGHDRVKELALHIHVVAAAVGMTDSEAQKSMLWALHKWLVAMIASWIYDNIENQAIFTLIGPQGKYKTTFFRFLLPPPLQSYFAENKKNSVGQKDDLIAMVENCLISLDEVDAFEGAELSKLKGVVTAERIKIRRPYAKAPEDLPRMASLCATTNVEHILTDLSGNRRWLCFKVSGIDDPRKWDIDYEQLYAQLLKEFRDGFPYYFTPEDEAKVNMLNEPFMLKSPEEQLISIRFRKPRGREPYQLMSSEMINLQLNYGRHTTLFSNRKIGDVMSRLGFKRDHKKSGYYYRVVEIPFDQQQVFIAEDNGGQSFELEDSQESDSQQLELPLET